MQQTCTEGGAKAADGVSFCIPAAAPAVGIPMTATTYRPFHAASATGLPLLHEDATTAAEPPLAYADIDQILGMDALGEEIDVLLDEIETHAHTDKFSQLLGGTTTDEHRQEEKETAMAKVEDPASSRDEGLEQHEAIILGIGEEDLKSFEEELVGMPIILGSEEEEDLKTFEDELMEMLPVEDDEEEEPLQEAIILGSEDDEEEEPLQEAIILGSEDMKAFQEELLLVEE